MSRTAFSCSTPRALARVDLLEQEVAERVERREDGGRQPHLRLIGALIDEVDDQRVDPRPVGVTEHVERLPRQLALVQHTGTDGVVQVVVDVGDPVREPHDLRLERGGRRHGPRMVHDAVAHLPRQVQALPVVLEVVDDPQALLAVAERAAQERRERLLAQMAERRVSQVVPERDGLRQVLVQAERARDRSGDVRDVERMGQADPVVVALGRQEHLRLVLQPAERLGVRDAVAIPLEDRADRILRLGRARVPSTPRRAWRRWRACLVRSARCVRAGWPSPSC